MAGNTSGLTAKSIADSLNGTDGYPFEYDRNSCGFSHEEEVANAGFVVAYGASDDLLELSGAIRDEIGTYGGAKAKLDADGFIPSFDEIRRNGNQDQIEKWFERERKGATITAEWCPQDDDCSWRISIDRPFEPFDILEDGGRFCRGIVFSIYDLKVA